MSARPRGASLFRRLSGAIALPFTDPLGDKGIFNRLTRAQPHIVRRLELAIPGWPQWTRPLRVAFLSDLHIGSHAGDVERLRAIGAELMSHTPDLVLHGGDFLNLQTYGGGRVPPSTIAEILSPLNPPLGQYAVLGNHDTEYGAAEVVAALEQNGIRVLDDRRDTIRFEGQCLDLVGLPDTHNRALVASAMLEGRPWRVPTIVLAHDPAWLVNIPAGPFITLSGHTHGGQLRFPLIGVVKNASHAPLDWSYGLIRDSGKLMYVTSGIGTSLLPLRWRVPPELVIFDLSGC